MITANVIRRVFLIRNVAQVGTGFTLDLDGRQYLVSAKHILNDVERANEIEVFHDNQWKSLPVRLTGHSDAVDVSVLAPTTLLTSPDLPVGPTAEGLVYGQEVCFLGFPFEMQGDFPHITGGYPLPFVKRALLSMMNGERESDMFLDGLNNKGFSGGPVVFRPYGANPSAPLQFAGVISGYLSVREPVVYRNDALGHEYAANTGLIRAAPIYRVHELIRANPNGLQLD